MSRASIIFSVSEFPQGRFDINRLSNQVRGLYRDYEVKAHAEGVIVITSKEILTQEEHDALQVIIDGHTGEPFDFLSKATSDQKRFKIQEILAMARDRADLAPAVPSILQYFNYRNKEFDGHIYYSATQELVDLIVADAAPGEPFEALLNSIVTEADGAIPAVKAFEFFIGKITGVI